MNETNRESVALWSAGHCVVCGAAGGAGLDVVPVDPDRSQAVDDPDAWIPVCASCASALADVREHGRRDDRLHPERLRIRREQVYDRHGARLVPPVRYALTQTRPGGGVHRFPEVGFTLEHLGDTSPVRVRVSIDASHESGLEAEGAPPPFVMPDPLYNGERPWNLNPRFRFDGAFELPEGYRTPGESVTLRIDVALIDRYGRRHPHLPVRFTYVPYGNYWVLEP